MNESDRLKFCFKTFERVLVRNTNVNFRANWIPNIYLYTSEGMHRLLRGPDQHESHCEILPYEGNEQLAGTNGFPITPWQPKEDELVAVSDGENSPWLARRFKEMSGNRFICYHEKYAEYQAWLLCEPLRNHFNVPEE